MNFAASCKAFFQQSRCTGEEKLFEVYAARFQSKFAGNRRRQIAMTGNALKQTRSVCLREAFKPAMSSSPWSGGRRT